MGAVLPSAPVPPCQGSVLCHPSSDESSPDSYISAADGNAGEGVTILPCLSLPTFSLSLLYVTSQAHYKPIARLGLEDTCLRLLVQVLLERSKGEVEGRGLSDLTQVA